MTFAHPETGQVLESREDFQAALDEIETRLIPLWRVRQTLRMAFADRFEGPPLPLPRWRTPAQEKVARCPRCGGKIE